ncbi:MAG: hypothetical protein ACYC6F_03245 [Longimicrobiales bacterium]
MNETGNQPSCLVCGRTSDEVPLLTFDFRGEERRICPQHLPVLIHSPARLAEVLPGADSLGPADHHD